MRYAVIVVGLIVAVTAIVVIVGSTLPVKHTVTREATYRATQSQLFQLVRNVSDYPSWQQDVTKVEILPDVNGKPRVRETNGGQAITYEIEEIVPGQRIVSRIADSNLPFGGSWTYELDPKGDATTLRITENGEVYNVIYRFVSAYLMGHSATIDKYLEAVSTRYPMVLPVS
ncbi:MAG TPA: SRPBCC family protein [Gemmatimonadaceae bacterium]|nr:SRPBCC family protein [Gemmatimonadaceae bacterium]